MKPESQGKAMWKKTWGACPAHSVLSHPVKTELRIMSPHRVYTMRNQNNFRPCAVNIFWYITSTTKLPGERNKTPITNFSIDLKDNITFDFHKCPTSKNFWNWRKTLCTNSDFSRYHCHCREAISTFNLRHKICKGVMEGEKEKKWKKCMHSRADWYELR